MLTEFDNETEQGNKCLIFFLYGWAWRKFVCKA